MDLPLLIIFLIVNKSKNKVSTNFDNKELGAISKEIQLLKDQFKSEMKLSLSEEMLKITKNSLESNERNNEKLERFQKNIMDSFDTRFLALNSQIDQKFIEINKKVDDKLSEGFKGTSETITQVRERLQAIDDAQKNIEKLSGDVVSLKNVLQGNQSRGQYGEYQLSMVLHNIFGDTEGCYAEQYTLKKAKDGDDVRADAVVFVPEPNKMICIDSKFPFQSYSKTFEAESEEEKASLIKAFSSDVKKHITAIKDKYIIPGKTAPEALMFIPNDGVFAFIHHNCKDVVEDAREKRVIITSPSTLPAILVTINMVKIQHERAKNAQIISNQLQMLGKQFTLFETEWTRFSKQLETASKSREQLNIRVSRITQKFDSISGSTISDTDEIENKEENILDSQD